jgi:hypothetical protein
MIIPGMNGVKGGYPPAGSEAHPGTAGAAVNGEADGGSVESRNWI